MKLAFCLFNYYPYGGLERDFMKIALECCRRGYNIDVYTMSWEGDIPSELNVKLIPVKGFTNHSRSDYFIRKIKPQLKSGQYDLVMGFNQMPELDVYFAGDVCYRASAKRKHHAWYRLTPRYRAYAKREQSVFQGDRKTQILYLVEPEKKQFIQYYQTPEESFHLLPPGIDKKLLSSSNTENEKGTFRLALDLPSNKNILLMVGSDFKRKGVDRTLHALASLPDELRDNTELYVIGKGKTAPLLRLAKHLNITEKIVFLGPRNDVEKWMRAADLFIHPAYEETAGMVLIESLIAGLPVIVTQNCGYAFHIQRSQAGKIITSPYHQENLNHSLKEILAENLYEEWRKNALDYAQSTDLYSLPGRTVDLLERFYKEKSNVA